MTLAEQIVVGGQVATEVTVGGRPVAVTGGDVAVDTTTAHRRSCTIAVAELADVDQLLAGEVRIRQGLYVDGVPHLRDLGLFSISEDSLSDSVRGFGLTVTGYDRSRIVARNRWIDPHVVAAGTNAGTAIATALADRYPGVRLNFAATGRTLPALVWGLERDNDPWADLQKAATSVGHELFFDRAGWAVFRPVPDPAVDAPRWTFAEGINLVSVGRRRSDASRYTRVIVTGESAAAGPPVRAVAVDTALEVVTGGPVPFFLTSAYVATQAQAEEAAAAELRRVSGRSELLDFTALANPEVDGHDIATVVRRDRSGIESVVAIQSVRFPLGVGGTMSVRTRERRVTA